MEPLDLAVGLWPTRSGLLHGGAGQRARVVPVARAVAGAVVGDHPFATDAEAGEKRGCPQPELGGGDGLFVSVQLAVRDAGPVVDRGVDEPVADAAVAARAVVAAAMDPPSASGGDPGDLLDVDVEKLARVVTLVAPNRLTAGGTITTVESSESSAPQDRLHGRSSQAGLVRDVIRAPAVLLT